jgi:integrase
VIVFETLKKRRKGIFRSIPVSSELIDMLVRVHRIDRRYRVDERPERLWSFSRMTAYRRIRRVMEQADLHGLHAVPKGLRHGFGVAAIQNQVPLNLVQRWLGHADMRTTALYAAAIGPEERAIATRMWRRMTPERRPARD